MSTPTWVTLANANQYSQVASGAVVTNFTTATDVSPGGSILGQAFQTSPAQLYPGQMWRFSANGIYSTTSSPGLSLGVYYGGASGSPICYGSVAAASAFTNCASMPWSLSAMGKLTTVGASVGIWQVVGFLTGLQPYSPMTGTAITPSLVTPMPQYTAAAQYDTSTAVKITVAATCTSSGAASVTCYNWGIEYLSEP